MKKILLFIVGIACTAITHAQLVLSELYVLASPGRQEYFELKNTSPAPQNADCYTLVSFFNNGGLLGFYVVNIPAITVAGEGFLVGSSQAPNFNYQNTAGTADFSWNAGNINRYEYVGGSLVLNNSGAPFNDIFLISNGSTSGSNGVYAVFLFKGSTLADAFIGAQNSIVVPSYITSLGQLTNTGGDACGHLSYNFNNINNENDDLFRNVTSAAGSDNGYSRLGAGCNSHGNWVKASNQGEHNPGSLNVGDHGTATAAQRIQATVTCVNATTVSYDITGGSSSAFPVLVSLYHDVNGDQFLDAGDVFISSQTDATASEPSKLFTHTAGQEDFIFVFDGQFACYDTTLALNCPGSIVLPVSFTSFTAARNGAGAILKWTTAMESNNRGFQVQRLQNGGRWENIGFVGSAASGGNSNEVLNYSFDVPLVEKGITQYRLEQVDRDGRIKYSVIRAIRSEGITGKPTIYPNPSRGIATILFSDGSNHHQVQVSDLSGRVLQQWNGVTDDNLKISNLRPGVYMVRITDISTGNQSNQRLIVN